MGRPSARTLRPAAGPPRRALARRRRGHPAGRSLLGLRNYRRSLKGLLQAGLARREFVPFYQPVVDSRSQQVVGFEALLRWQRGGGLIPPGAFIDYAEEQQLILPMTSQLLEKVIADLPKLAPASGSAST